MNTLVCRFRSIVYTVHAALQGESISALSATPRRTLRPRKVSVRPSIRLLSAATSRRFIADVSTMFEPGADPPSKVDWYSSPSTPIT